MRLVALVVLLLTARASAAEKPFDYPVTSPGGHFDAVFSKTGHEESKSEGTKLAIKDRDHRTLFEQELSRDVACNAQWTHDGKFLVITALNGAGHQPWHSHAYVFSLDAREIRALEEPDKTPFVSAEIFMQPLHTAILIGHTFEHDLIAPDDPVLLRFDLAALWPKLRRTNPYVGSQAWLRVFLG